MPVLLLGTVVLPLLDKGVCGIGTTFNLKAKMTAALLNLFMNAKLLA
jgi:hypothetical protein